MLFIVYSVSVSCYRKYNCFVQGLWEGWGSFFSIRKEKYQFTYIYIIYIYTHREYIYCSLPIVSMTWSTMGLLRFLQNGDNSHLIQYVTDLLISYHASRNGFPSYKFQAFHLYSSLTGLGMDRSRSLGFLWVGTSPGLHGEKLTLWLYPGPKQAHHMARGLLCRPPVYTQQSLY